MYETNGGVAIQTLSFDEIDLVDGGSKTSENLEAVAAGAMVVAGGASLMGNAPVAAGAAVVGLVAYAAAQIID